MYKYKCARLFLADRYATYLHDGQVYRLANTGCREELKRKINWEVTDRISSFNIHDNEFGVIESSRGKSKVEVPFHLCVETSESLYYFYMLVLNSQETRSLSCGLKPPSIEELKMYIF